MTAETDGLASLLGLTEYEARVYRALLQEPGATAYKLGKRSGVPLSRVYEAAERLAAKGAAVREHGEPAQYTAVDPDSLVSAARARVTRQLDSLVNALNALQSDSESCAPMWIRGEERVLAHVAGAISAAELGITLLADPRIQSRVRRTQKSGWPIPIQTLTMPDSGEALFVILIDKRTAIFGKLGKDAQALSTAHPALVKIIADYARLIGEPPAQTPRIHVSIEPSGFHESTGWLGWEEEKHRRLLRH